MTTKKYSIWLTGLMAIVLSIIANLIVLFVLGPQVSGPTPLHALSVLPVAILSFIGAVGAIIVYGILRIFMKNPNRTFIFISILVFLASLIPDYLLLGSTSEFAVGATIPSVSTLMLMHAVAALIIVATLVKLTKSRI